MRQLACYAFFLTAMLCLCVKARRKPCALDTNCTKDLPFFFKKTFKLACIKHDICYSCGSKYDWTRKQCDTAFLRDMRKLCSKRSSFKGSCLVFARFYYGMAVLYGEDNFEKSSPRWCRRRRLKWRGDPSRIIRG